MKSPRFQFIAALLLLTIALGAPREGAAAVRETKSPAPALPASKPQSEEHWLVDETARTVAELLAFAKDRAGVLEFSAQPDPIRAHAWLLSTKLGDSEVKAQVVWKTFIWSPEESAVWARQLTAAWKLTAEPVADGGGTALLAALTSPAVKVWQQERARLSAALSEKPLDAELHAQAALLTAAFALRECAGGFTDFRRELCRCAAHLAIARALAPAAGGPVRGVAEAALEALCGRETPALAALGTLEKENAPGTAPWVRALRLRATGDWRAETPNATLLEQLETFRARAESVGPTFAEQWLGKRKSAAWNDWRRLMLAGDLSVGEGHTFTNGSIEEEIVSLKEDYAAIVGDNLDNESAVTALSTPTLRAVGKNPAGAAAVSVLGWDFWSAQHQRHLCQSIRKTNTFYRDDWSVRQYVKVQQSVRDKYGALTLFPLLEREVTEEAEAFSAITPRCLRLIEAHPELLTRQEWYNLTRPDGEKPAMDGLPGPARWMRGVVPFGTIGNFDARSTFAQLPDLSEAAWWQALLALAPSNLQVHRVHLGKQYRDRTEAPLAVIEAEYAGLKDFNGHALSVICEALHREHSPKYFETMERLCQWDPDRYFELGDHYRAQDQPDLAAGAYQKGVDRSADSVLAANESGWLVNYLFDHDQKKQALKVATMAANAYSATGLEVMASLQEKMGALEQAEDYFKKILDRYRNDFPLTNFYLRNRTKNPAYEAFIAPIEKDVFPNGKIKVTLADFDKPPTDGCVYTTANELSRSYGLAIGDVLVARDGMRVENMSQDEFVLQAGTDTKMRLIVWQRTAYREIEVDLPGRRFGVIVKNLKAE